VSFAAPLWLMLLASLPLAAGAVLAAGRRRRRFAVRFTAFDTLAGVAATVPRRRRHLPLALGLLAAATLVLAVARPQVSVAVPVERASVMLVIDVSGSMNADDVAPTRMAATQRAAGQFVDEVPDGQRVGLIPFSGAASVLQPLTGEHEAVRAGIDSLRADGATATGEALGLALDELREARDEDGGEEGGQAAPPAAIVMLTDGRRTTGRDPVPVARQAGREEIPVFTISLGTPDGVLEDPRRPFMPPQPVPPDPETMAEVARVSGGETFDVDDADQLSRIYESLGSQLATEQDQREVTAAFAGGGLLLLLAALVVGLRGRARLP
jgi:Ca-activated chloride channel homolog